MTQQEAAPRVDIWDEGVVYVTEENITDKEAVDSIVFLIKKLAPFLGGREIAFKHLIVHWRPSAELFNGMTQPYLSPMGDMNVEIVLNSNYLRSQTSLLATFLHELAHVLIMKPLTMLPMYTCPSGGHTRDWVEENVTLLKLAKSTPALDTDYILDHHAMNVYTSVIYSVELD